MPDVINWMKYDNVATWSGNVAFWIGDDDVMRISYDTNIFLKNSRRLICFEEESR